MIQFRRAKRLVPNIDTAPLIDVVFQLIIFIMLSSTFVLQPGIRVDLPTAQTTQADTERRIIVKVPWRETEPVFVNGVEVPLDGLRPVLERLRQEQQTHAVVVAADRRTSHGRVVTVMDQARAAGLEAIAIATQQRPHAGGS